MDALLDEYQRIVEEIKKLTDRKKDLTTEILSTMKGARVETSCYRVSKVRMIFVKTSLEAARNLGFTKFEEVVDKGALKESYLAGEEAPDVSESEYVRVSKRDLNKVSRDLE